jgi:hypothetical protein
MKPSILKIEIEHEASNNAINCLIVNGRLILSSIQEGVILSTVDIAADELSKALSSPVLEADKKIECLDEFHEIDFQEMISGAIEYCEDNIEHFQAMPIEYECFGVLFSFDEMIAMISNEKHHSFTQLINNHNKV